MDLSLFEAQDLGMAIMSVFCFSWKLLFGSFKGRAASICDNDIKQ